VDHVLQDDLSELRVVSRDLRAHELVDVVDTQDLPFQDDEQVRVREAPLLKLDDVYVRRDLSGVIY
jgi:hypothetical protein